MNKNCNAVDHKCICRRISYNKQFILCRINCLATRRHTCLCKYEEGDNVGNACLSEDHKNCTCFDDTQKCIHFEHECTCSNNLISYRSLCHECICGKKYRDHNCKCEHHDNYDSDDERYYYIPCGITDNDWDEYYDRQTD